MNNKGFTLIELIAVIVIMGIIAGIAIPSINRISYNNNVSKHEIYSDSLISAAKLYNDSYNSDIFGDLKYGCADIDYGTLLQKNLIKDINIDNETCSDIETFVRILKVNDTYKYQVSLRCKNEKNNEEVYKKSNISSDVSCNNNGILTGPIVEISQPNYSNVDEKNSTQDKKINVQVRSTYGLKENSSILYNWSTDPEGKNIVDLWTERKLNEKVNEKTFVKEVVKINTKQLPTGKYYLVVSLSDEYGNFTLQDAADNNPYIDKYISGPYIVDKTGPDITSAEIKAEGAYYKYVNNYSVDTINGSNFTVCLSNNDKCNKYVAIDKAQIAKKDINDKVYIYAKDLSGNISKREITVK